MYAEDLMRLGMLPYDALGSVAMQGCKTFNDAAVIFLKLHRSEEDSRPLVMLP